MARDATDGCTSTRGRATATTPTSAPSSPTARCGGCATRTSCASASCASSASTCSTSAKADTLHARRLLARYGEGLALDLLDHKEADLLGKGEDGPRDVHELERLQRFRAVVEQERASPHRLSDLSVDGTDLIELGYHPGPELGRTLRGAARGGRRRPRAQPARRRCSTRAKALLAVKNGDSALAIRWDAPGYVVAFTTRVGGVSEGPFDSLNLGGRRDDPARVAENRRRACDALGLDPSRLTVNRQRHTPTVHRAVAGRTDEPGDGLWTDEPGLPLLALTADCLPIAVARANGGAPALAVAPRGLARPRRGRGRGGRRRRSATGRQRAIVGPAVGPCCYEVGPEVSARFDADLTRDGILDLWTAAERALRRAGVAEVERVDRCTQCNPEEFFSHRRTGPVRGVQGVLGAVAG